VVSRGTSHKLSHPTCTSTCTFHLVKFPLKNELPSSDASFLCCLVKLWILDLLIKQIGGIGQRLSAIPNLLSEVPEVAWPSETEISTFVWNVLCLLYYCYFRLKGYTAAVTLEAAIGGYPLGRSHTVRNEG
jgi:hypothetical protein